MNVEPVISVQHAAKKFAKRLNKSMLYGVQDVARDVVGLSTRPDRLRPDEFWAVDDVSFELKQGDTLGIVGPNGSGKSTLLKMLNGIIYPDRGRLSVRGRVGALIEVGAGFHPMLTGRENIFVNGAILGMSKAEIKGKFDAIVDFAEIGDFLDVPVKNYSSGMYVRLGFAVAAHCEPAVLLVDEVLSVGDIGFQRKCYRYFEENVLNNGVTLILVSHSIYAIARMCAQGLLLHKGRQEYFGDVSGLTARFYEIMRRNAGGNGATQNDASLRPGAGEIRLQRLELRDAHGQTVDHIRSGDGAEFRLTLHAGRNVDHLPSLVVKIMDQANTLISLFQFPLEMRKQTRLTEGDHRFVCRIDRINLIPGKYPIHVKIGGGSDLLQDNVMNAATLTIEGGQALYESCEGAGMVYLAANWSTEE